MEHMRAPSQNPFDHPAAFQAATSLPNDPIIGPEPSILFNILPIIVALVLLEVFQSRGLITTDPRTLRGLLPVVDLVEVLSLSWGSWIVGWLVHQLSNCCTILEQRWLIIGDV